MRSCAVLLRLLTVAALATFAGALFAQQNYPHRPIRWITPYPPGGSTTALSRLIGEKLSEAFGQNVIIDNRPGGNTVIGVDAVAKAAPDGYTILLGGNTQIVLNLLLRPPFDIFKDFAPVTILAKTNYILVVNPALPVNDLQEFIAYAKARRKSCRFGGKRKFTLMGELLNDASRSPYREDSRASSISLGERAHPSQRHGVIPTSRTVTQG